MNKYRVTSKINVELQKEDSGITTERQYQKALLRYEQLLNVRSKYRDNKEANILVGLITDYEVVYNRFL